MPDHDSPSPSRGDSAPAIDRHAARRLSAATRRALTAELLAAISGREPSTAPSRGLFPPELAAYLPVLAEGHGVAALVAERLGPSLPPGPAATLADAAKRTRARGLRLAADRDALSAALVAASVPFAALKWAALAGRLYGEAALRPAADLDLWVPEGSCPGADRVLRRQGYVAGDVTWKHRVYIRPDNRAVVDPRGEHPDNPRPVELHAQLRESFRGLALTLALDDVVGLPDTQLSDATHLLHLAAHATVDALSRRLRLIQLVDLARLAAALDESVWPELVARAANPDAARFIWPAVMLARRELGAAVPYDVLEGLGVHVKAALAEWLSAAELDELSWFGGPSAQRPLDEVLRVWPRNPREVAAVWRFILVPGRAALADRYPRLSASRAWWAMYPRHAAYSSRLLWRRWRNRG